MELVYTIDSESIYIRYITEEENSKRDIIGVTIFLPNDYAKTYNFSHILLTLGNLKRPFDIKEVFFKILKQIPGDVLEYSNICLTINNDRFMISNGHLTDYYDDFNKERISSTATEEGERIYNYYREYNNRQNIFICDVLNSKDNFYDNHGLSEVTVDGIRLYAQAFISEIEKKISELDNNKGKKKIKKKIDA